MLNVTEKEDLDGSHPRRLTSQLKRRDKTSRSSSRSSSMRGQLRSEMLYQNFRDKQERLLERRLEIERERLKDCTFKPRRESKPSKYSADEQFERVYKFSV